jgi:3-oxoacyl-[acyl-carrier-protein] synthase-1
MPFSEKTFLKKGAFEAINLARHGVGSIGHRLQRRFGFRDQISFSTACTSSGNATIFATELLRSGIAQSAIVIGADALCLTTVNGFDALGVLSESPCLPFDRNRDGMNVSEAAATLLLQNRPEGHAPIRIAGVGSSSDAHHITQPHPEGEGAFAAMHGALKDADIPPDAVAYINAHATATPANDAAEAAAIAQLFGDRPAVHGSKAVTGHALGAASALELCITAWVLQNRRVPANFHIKSPLETPIHLPQSATTLQGRYGLCNSFAFGGNNTAIILEGP